MQRFPVNSAPPMYPPLCASTHAGDTAFYAKYNSSGPGAHAGQRDSHTKLSTAAEAARYATKRFLAGADGWDPTSVLPLPQW